MITADVLRQIMPRAGAAAALYAAPLDAAMLEFEIDTPNRMRCFLAQVAHESMQLQRTREIWGPTVAQLRYEGRRELGNTMAGDGERYMGRGLLQITGRANYGRCSLALYLDDRLLDQPRLLEEPVGASRSAAWYWKCRSLNKLADADDFARITLSINGSLRTLAQREAFLSAASQVIV